MDYDRTEKDSLSLTTADVARAGGRPREESNERHASPRGDPGVMNHEGLQQRETAAASEPDRPPAPFFRQTRPEICARAGIASKWVLWTSREAAWSGPTSWSPRPFPIWRKASPRSAKNLSTTGFEAMTSLPRNCGFHCGVIARSSNVF